MEAPEATPLARAIWGYSRWKQPKLATESGVPYNRLRAILSENNESAVELSELYALADATGVPRRFIDLGFTPLRVIGEPLQSQLEGIEDRLRALESELRAPPATSKVEAGEDPVIGIDSVVREGFVAAEESEQVRKQTGQAKRAKRRSGPHRADDAG